MMEIVVVALSLPLLAGFGLALLGCMAEHRAAILMSIPVMIGIVLFAAV